MCGGESIEKQKIVDIVTGLKTAITGIPFELVAPKNNKTKVSADYFKKLTGWEGRTNEHERDCAMLVFGY